MVDKIIFFRYLPLTKKIKEDFFFEELRQAGFNVNYWYLPFLIDVPNGVESIEDKGMVTIQSYAELKKRIREEKINNTVFFSIVTYEYRVLRLFRILTRYKCRLAVFRRNAIHVNTVSATERLSHVNIQKIFNFLKNKTASWAKRHGFVKPYDYIFCAGENALLNLGGFSPKEKEPDRHFKVNSDGYDIALSKRGGKRIVDDKYIVFLDECLPLHPDLKLLNLNSVNPDVYYKQLNSFFRKVENEFGFPVVIAAHPKALIYKEKDFFEGRMVIFGKSAELVRDSEFVLVHDSTSIVYAVSCEKPIISLTSSSIEKNQVGNYYATRSLSQYLNTHLIYFDIDDLKREYVTIDEGRYNKFKYSFLTSKETEDKQTSALMIEYLRKL